MESPLDTSLERNGFEGKYGKCHEESIDSNDEMMTADEAITETSADSEQFISYEEEDTATDIDLSKNSTPGHQKPGHQKPGLKTVGPNGVNSSLDFELDATASSEDTEIEDGDEEQSKNEDDKEKDEDEEDGETPVLNAKQCAKTVTTKAEEVLTYSCGSLTFASIVQFGRHLEEGEIVSDEEEEMTNGHAHGTNGRDRDDNDDDNAESDESADDADGEEEEPEEPVHPSAAPASREVKAEEKESEEEDVEESEDEEEEPQKNKSVIENKAEGVIENKAEGVIESKAEGVVGNKAEGVVGNGAESHESEKLLMLTHQEKLMITDPVKLMITNGGDSASASQKPVPADSVGVHVQLDHADGGQKQLEINMNQFNQTNGPKGKRNLPPPGLCCNIL